MRTASGVLLAIVGLGAAPLAAQISGSAGDFESDQTSGAVVAARVSHTFGADTVAVVGFSQPQPSFGYGGIFYGGWYGVFASAVSGGGTGNRFGVYGEAGGSPINYGVQGVATSDIDSSASYAIYGSASCSGVGCSAYAGYFDGNLAYTGSLINASDQMLKKNVAPIDSTLGRVLALEVVTYEFKEREIAGMNLPKGPRVGFVAQQVAEVAPELVADVAQPAADGSPSPASQGLGYGKPVKVVSEPIRYKGIKTMEMIPFLVRAIQEQQAEIEALKAEIAPLRNRLAELEGQSAGRSRIASAAYRGR